MVKQKALLVAIPKQDRGKRESMTPLGMKDDSIEYPESAHVKRKEMGSSGIEDMPCVFTIGDGPNGRKVEGILYKYGKVKKYA